MLRSMKLKSLNPHISCVLCGGYLVDATTIIECLHSFCRSCIVRYLETSFHCPVCDVEIHKTRPLLHIKPDRVLQDIVYKLVPGLCHEGKIERKKFSKDVEKDTLKESNKEEQSTSDETGANTEEKSNQNRCPDIDDPVSIQLEYYGRKRFRTEEQIFPTRYLRCSSKVTVGVLKKFLSIKFGIPPTHQPELVRSDEILDNHITMTELSRIYGLYSKSFLDIQYIFLPNKEDDELKTEGQEAKRVRIDHLQRHRQNEPQQQMKRKRRRRRNQPQDEDDGQQYIQPKQRKRRMKNVQIPKERRKQDSNEVHSLPNGLVTKDIPSTQRRFYQATNERQTNEQQHAVHQREREDKSIRDKQTIIKLQYQDKQEEQLEDRLSMEKQHVVEGCYQNRTEQTTVQQTQNQNQQSKENETTQHDSVCDKPNFYQLNKYIDLSRNYTETEIKDKESLESALKISPPPLRSRNLDNTPTSTSCTDTFVCPSLWNGIEPTAL